MTKSYVISGLGARYRDEALRVPENVEIHFYFTRLKAPQIYKARSILDRLMVELGMFPDWVAVPGELLPAYFCWAHPGPAPISGVFRRSTAELYVPLDGTDAQRPVSLAHLVQEVAGSRIRDGKLTAIHWLVRSADVAGSPAALDLQYPARLRSSGGAEGGDESAHVPLTRF
jgi:hypothetical protein